MYVLTQVSHTALLANLVAVVPLPPAPPLSPARSMRRRLPRGRRQAR